MDLRSSRGIRTGSLAATLVAAFAASICCVGPLAAALLGLTGLAAFARYERYRPYFTVLTLLLLASTFYLTYRPRPVAACEPGSLCEETGPDRLGRLNRVVLWIVTAIVVLVLAFPTWSGWIWG